MAVKIKRRIFVEDNDYFVNEKGKKYTRLGFDDITPIGFSSFKYRLGQKINIVSRPFVQMNKDKEEYIKSAIYDDIIEFPTFYLLFRKDGFEGVKVFEKNDNSKIFPTGKLVFCEKGRYAILVDDKNTTAIYSSDELTEMYKMPIFSMDFSSVERKGKEINSSADLFSFVKNLEKSSSQVSNEAEIETICNFFRQILNDDVLNYNQPTLKYVLTDKSGNLVLEDLNRDINEYVLVLKEFYFDSATQAKTNAQNVLNFYKTKMTLLFKKNLNKRPNTNPLSAN